MRKILVFIFLCIALSSINLIKVGAMSNLPVSIVNNGLIKLVPPVKAPSNKWIKHSASTSVYSTNIITSGIVVDNLGNEYVTGYLNASADFGNGNIIINAGGNDHNDFFIIKYNSNGVIQWVKHSVSNSSTIRPYGIINDILGNIYITGLFDGTANFGTGNIKANGINDFFVAKFNSAGVTQWVQHSVSNSSISGSIYLQSISIDNNKNLYITGNFQATADFGTGKVIPNGSNDFFVVKFNTNGVAQWVQHSISNSSNVYSEKIATDSHGNSYITGHFGSGTTNFGTGAITANVNTGHFYEDFFIVKFNTNGLAQWTKHSVSSTGEIISKSIAIDNTNNPYITGYFLNGTVNFGKGAVTTTGNDFFVIKYDMNGVLQFIKHSLTNSEIISSVDIKFDRQNNFYLTGDFSGTVNLGSGSITNPVTSRMDFFIAKFTSNGLNTWVQHSITDAFYINSNALAVDNFGTLYIVGGFEDTVNLGTGAITPNGTLDFFIAKYNTVSKIKRLY